MKATRDFSYDGQEYTNGATFRLPDGWEVDTQSDAQLQRGDKNRARRGCDTYARWRTTFTTDTGRRVTLPVA